MTYLFSHHIGKTTNKNHRNIVALRPPSISASSTMGGATLLGACLTGLQRLRGPLGWEPAEAAGTNNVVSKSAGVDIAYREPESRLPRRRYEDMTKAPREPGSRLPRSRLRRQYEDVTSSQGAGEPAATELAATTVRRRRKLPGSQGAGFHGAGCDDCLISVYSHTSTAATQLTVHCARSSFYTDRLARTQLTNQQCPKHRTAL